MSGIGTQFSSDSSLPIEGSSTPPAGEPSKKVTPPLSLSITETDDPISGPIVSLAKSLLSSKSPTQGDLRDLANVLEALLTDKSISRRYAALGDSAKELLDILKPKFNWKEDVHSRADARKLDPMRLQIVRAVGDVADIAAGKMGLQKSEWTTFGTSGAQSDIDYNAEPVKGSENPYYENALLGKKTAIAGLAHEHQFGGSALTQLDTVFNPPHFSEYVTDTLTDETAKAIFSKASFTGIFLQMKTQMPAEDFKKFKEQFMSELDSAGLSDLKAVMQEIEDDVNELEKTISRMEEELNGRKNDLPHIMSFYLSEKLAELGKEIANTSGVEKERLVGKFYYLFVVLGRFHPELFYTKGGYDVVCKDRGSQQQVAYHSDLEKVAEETGETIQPEKTEKFKKSSAESLHEAMGENFAYNFHKEGLIDASKSLKRSYDAAHGLIEQLEEKLKRMESERSLTSLPLTKEVIDQLKTELHNLKTAVVGRRRDQIATLEATKRKKWDEYSYVSQVRKMQLKKEIGEFSDIENDLKSNKSSILRSHNPYGIIKEFLKSIPDKELKQQILTEVQSKFAHIDKRSLTKSEKNALWELLMNKTSEQFHTLANKRIQSVSDVASRYFREAQLSYDKFQAMPPSKRASLMQKELEAQLGAGLGKRLSALTKTVGRAADIATTVNQINQTILKELLEIQQRGIAEKQMTTMKSDFLKLGEKVEDIDEKELFSKVKTELTYLQAKLSVLSLKCGVITPPCKGIVRIGDFVGASAAADTLPA
jgi:hypothetical protein